MSFFDDASLVMIPSGYKDQKVYSVKPIDGSGDLTFSRGSDIEATRVNANGYIEKAKVNLLLQSNSFDSVSWTKTVTSVTSGQAGYDGTSDAWLLEATATSGSLRQNYSDSGVFCFSSYAKAGTTDWIRISFIDAGSHDAWFDLSTGSVGTVTGINADITSVGAGWYRINIAANVSSLVTVRFYPASGDGINGDSGDNVYIQDAQINYGLVAQEYQETTTTTVVSGITNDLPRLDYSGGASCPSLKLEPSRTNILTNDTYYGGSDWNKIGVSPTANNAISPEGVTNAVLLKETAINDQHSLYPTISVTSGNAYTASCFVKQGTGSAAPQYIGFRFRGGGFTDAGGLVVDLVNKVATYEAGSLSDHKIEDYGNGWLRVSITQTASVTSSTAGLVLFFNNNISNAYSTDYTGDTNADVLVYGMQIESGNFVSSLIPCYGTSATRTADACSKTGISSLIGQTEGTLFIDIDFKNMGTGVVQVIASIDDSANNKRIEIWANGNSVNGFIGATTGGNITIGTTTLTDGHHKLVLAYKQSGDHAFYIDGTQIGTSSTSYTIPSLNNFRLFYWNNALYPQVEYKQALLFPTRLPNSDLATLTSL